MNENKIDEKKLNILKELLVGEEHSLEDLKRLVEKSKSFLKIENKTGKIILSPDCSFKVNDQLILFLIGEYFSHELGLNKNIPVTSRYLSENLGIAQTTLSGPLGELVRKNIVSRDEGAYSIKYYKIEKQLDELVNIYLLKKEATIVSKPRPKKRKINSQKKRSTTIIKPKLKKEFDEGHFLEEIKKYSLNRNELNSVFNFDGKSIILLRGFKSTDTQKCHLKSSLLTLVANRLYFGMNEIDSSELRNILRISGVPRLTPLSSNLKEFPTFIVHKRGPIGSTKTSYEITQYGLQKGIILLKDILNNTSNLDIDFKPHTTGMQRVKAPRIEIDNDKLTSNIAEFAKTNQIDENKIKMFFDFQPDGLRLLESPSGKNRKELQIKSLMLLGIIVKKVYQIDNFDGKQLLKDSHISYDRLDLLEGSTKYRKYFSTKRPKSSMQLIYPGQLQAIKMLKDFIETKDCEL